MSTTEYSLQRCLCGVLWFGSGMAFGRRELTLAAVLMLLALLRHFTLLRQVHP